MLKKEFTIDYRVYIEDTDLMGIVYHPRYLFFFERARTEMLRSYGFSLSQLAEQNIHFAIRDIQMVFHYPARIDDILSIESSIDTVSACSLGFVQHMFNQNRQAIAEARVKVVTVDQFTKPRPFAKTLLGD